MSERIEIDLESNPDLEEAKPGDCLKVVANDGASLTVKMVVAEEEEEEVEEVETEPEVSQESGTAMKAMGLMGKGRKPAV
jgi:TusA-related sulfurtransferase